MTHIFKWCIKLQYLMIPHILYRPQSSPFNDFSWKFVSYSIWTSEGKTFWRGYEQLVELRTLLTFKSETCQYSNLDPQVPYTQQYLILQHCKACWRWCLKPFYDPFHKLLNKLDILLHQYHSKRDPIIFQCLRKDLILCP